MNPPHPALYVAFVGHRRIAWGVLPVVARAAREAVDRGAREPVLVFDNATSHPVDLDLSGSPEEVARRYAHGGAPWESEPVEAVRVRPVRRGPGRPKLGVVGREVTLLPRHWAWLGAQRGGASATLRRLVDQARKQTAGADRLRRAQDAAYRFMVATVGDEPGFEEATRALYAGDAVRYETESEPWPADFRDHARRLANRAFAAAVAQGDETNGVHRGSEGVVRYGGPQGR